jgi:cytidylate kinase
MMNKKTIIAFCGHAQSGKDTAARILIEKHNFTRIAFADPLREMLYALNPMVFEQTRKQSEGEIDYVFGRVAGIVDQIGWEGAKKIAEVRELLQRLGTDAGRNVLGQNIWIETAMKKAKALDTNVVFTDVRFQNEVDAVRAAGGTVIRIEREGTGPVNEHVSDKGISDLKVDAVIRNNWDKEDLAFYVESYYRILLAGGTLCV